MTLTGRTTGKCTRVYLAGYDMSCHIMQVGTLGVDCEYKESSGLCWSVKGGLLDQAAHTVGPITGILSAGVAGDLQTVIPALVGSEVSVGVAIGIRETPTYGCPVYATNLPLKRYAGLDEGGLTALTLEFGGNYQAASLAYRNPWGVCLHPLQQETGANTGTTNVVDNGAATTGGGYLFYCLTAINAGTVTLSVDDSADGSSYSALSGATSGALSAPASGIVSIGTTATVRRYLRWQLAFAGGASAATFFAAFVRG